MLTLEIVRIVLYYDPETGKWKWLKNRGGNRGKAGTWRKDGRIQIRLYGKFYLSSRLAWFYMTGEWPTEIDHIDRNRANDRWTNLREVSRSENLKNKPSRPLKRNRPVWLR